MPAFDDEDRPKKKIAHEIGQELTLLSVAELTDRIGLMREEIARLEADIASLERQMGDLDIRIEEAKATFKHQIMNGLQETLQNLREIEVTLQTSRDLRDYRAEDAGIRDEDPSKNTIMISRTTQQGANTFKASYDTIVEPGDVIEVKRKIPEATGRPALSNEASLPQ